MKTLTLILVLIFTALFLVFASCSKNNEVPVQYRYYILINGNDTLITQFYQARPTLKIDNEEDLIVEKINNQVVLAKNVKKFSIIKEDQQPILLKEIKK